MSKYIDFDYVKTKKRFNMKSGHHFVWMQDIYSAPSLDLVRCGECKHRPVKEDADGENYGFNLIEPTDGDERCPCLVSDGWYSWMPKDDFYCGYGERKEKQ